MTTIERLRNAARWAVAHPDPTVWGDGDVTYASLMTANPIIVLALLDVAEAARAQPGYNKKALRLALAKLEA